MFAALFLALAQTALPTASLLHPPPWMLDEARAMTTAQLADALLPAGHPPIVESVVHPYGREAPVGWIVNVELVAKAVPATAPGFCAATIYTVAFQPIGNTIGMPIVPASPAMTRTETVYRLADTDRPVAERCQASRDSFFRPYPQNLDRQFALIRLLAAAQKRALADRPQPFPVTFNDSLADGMEAYERGLSLPKGTPSVVERIPDAARAMALFPVTRVFMFDVGLTPRRTEPALAEAHAGDRSGEPLRRAEIWAGRNWEAEIAYRGDRIVRLHLIRRLRWCCG